MTLDGGTRAPLARASAGGVKGPKVGQYTVMLQDFETVAVKALSARNLEKCQYVVIDEIGKMECFSTKFQSLVRKIFSSDSTHIIAHGSPEICYTPMSGFIISTKATG